MGERGSRWLHTKIAGDSLTSRTPHSEAKHEINLSEFIDSTRLLIKARGMSPALTPLQTLFVSVSRRRFPLISSAGEDFEQVKVHV
jgi:hypothetical protein